MSETPPSAPTPSPAPPPDPLSRAELVQSLRQPLRVLDLVLAEKPRLVATVAHGRDPAILLGILLATSIVFSIPYGAVLDLRTVWRIAALFVGSMLICFPSLHVFSAYIGLRVTAAQNLALALLITSVAAVFTFAFAPILWFLDITMDPESRLTSAHVSAGLLALSLLAGLAQLARCLHGASRPTGFVPSPVLLVAWQALFTFICYRMARLLDLV